MESIDIVGNLLEKTSEDTELKELKNEYAILIGKIKELPTENIDISTIIEEANKQLVVNENTDTNFIKKPIEKAEWILNMMKNIDAAKFNKIFKRKKALIDTLKIQKHGPKNRPWQHVRNDAKFLKEKFEITDTFSKLLGAKIRYNKN